MELKDYQIRTLEILEKFLRGSYDCAAAFEKYRDAEGYNETYQPLLNMEKVPYVCLRLPTGGGKTLIGTHAIKIAAENVLEREYPFVLWLVPSNEIRNQTLKVLRSPDSFYGKILYEEFAQVNIFDVTEFRQLRPQDLKQKLNICVATFQAFRVKDKGKDEYKVYQPNEELGACFSDIPKQDYFIVDDKGRYQSFINLISYIRPLMIVDEAHNYSTPLSFDITKRLRPAAVIELTATPAVNSNVLVKITAQELCDEDMIKFPIIVGEVADSPEKTMDLTVQKRAALEELAYSEDEYIRPIALYQAENKNKEYNVDKIKKYLTEEAKISEEEIAIATGDRRELDGVNLYSRECKIRHIITVQALKEGWDCPFASVFCSVANTHSSKDAEQLLGRVLRMPYAKRRKIEDLNKSYAYFKVGSWTEAVAKIKDNLTGMGFEKNEIEDIVNSKQPKLFDDKTTVEIVTSAPPVTDTLYIPLIKKIKTEKIGNAYKVKFEDLNQEDVNMLVNNDSRIFKNPVDRGNFLTALNQPQYAKSTPAQKVDTEFSIPQLCFDFGSGAKVVEGEDFIPSDWKITDSTKDYSLPIGREDNDVKTYTFTSDGNKIEYSLDNDAFNEFNGKTEWSLPELIIWLEEKISINFITPEDFEDFTRRVMERLTKEKNFTESELVRLRFTIKKLLEEKIRDCIEKCRKEVYQTTLIDTDNQNVSVTKDVTLTFNPENYPAKRFHEGCQHFGKHFYSKIGIMNDEEIFCAQCIDVNKNVETWIRNIESDSKYSFWLPLHKGRFYPDFVLKLVDGTYAVIEYKGEHLKTGEDTKEKKSVGELWAQKSNGLCKFLLATKKDDDGRDISKQIHDFLS
ncbi:MAG: DEAD/DEAH box helicase family protein [Selenomonadaceae bacterium]|nr:DEAD/DEAH box helicase family protein [Selenomonadaceae bacterium]